MKTLTTVKSWGHSMGVVVPIDVVQKQKLRPNDIVEIEIKKRPTLMSLFGIVKFAKSAQRMKDEEREAWGI